MSNLRLPLLIALLLGAPAVPAQTAPQKPAHPPEARHHYDRAHKREAPTPVPPAAWNGQPRLVVILTLNNFRAGALDRWRADFEKDHGFSMLLDRGAWFSDCYFDYANTEAAPGDAAIATGAYTNGNGISGDQWWTLARNRQRPVSATEDERYKLVGLPAASIPGGQAGASGAGPKYVTGNSPQNLLASTLGDELRLATAGQSRVYSIALLDRDAVLSAGAGANGAYWIDPASGDWISSSFYMPTLPDWVSGFNSGDNISLAEQATGVTNATNFYQQIGTTPAVDSYELNFAESLIQNEQLGQRNVTDLLTIALSAGAPQPAGSYQEEQAVDSLDAQLDGFFAWLDKNIPGEMGNVWIALTANRGVAPDPATAAGYGLNAATLDLKKMVANLNLAMNMKFSPGEKIEYVMPKQSLPYISLNEAEFMKDGIDEQEAEQAVQLALPGAIRSLAPPQPEPLPSSSPIAGTQPATLQPSDTRLAPRPVLFRSYTRVQLTAGSLPPNAWGRLIANSYSPNGGWYVMVIPAAYQAATGNGDAAFGPWAYNRHVPLALYGAPFAPGEYLNQVQPVDLAPTLAALLGIHEPSASVGQVLTEALKPARDVVYPKVVPPKPQPHAAPAKKSAAPQLPVTNSAPAQQPAAPATPGAAPEQKPATPGTAPAQKPTTPANKAAPSAPTAKPATRPSPSPMAR
jgi:hypothetical protein